MFNSYKEQIIIKIFIVFLVSLKNNIFTEKEPM